MTRQRLLLVAYHFPPLQGSTGISRTLAFSRYLQDNGWDVCILTIHTGAYEDISSENEKLIPPKVRVERAWGRDARKSFAICGRYPTLLALPDRWQSWILGGLYKGSKVVRSWSPDVIMSTYPIPSAHAIAYLLQRRFNLPWIAEFRDPMLQQNYPSRESERWAFSKIENLVFENASRIVVTTDGCRRMYADRFPNRHDTDIVTIPNGYDPAIFDDASSDSKDKKQDKIVLLHSGVLYASERNPRHFFEALHSLNQRGVINESDVEFRFRASGNDDSYRSTVAKLGIQNLCQFLPRVSYQQAVGEMLSVDALMIFQAASCSDQIPAKTYEYFFAQKPILGLTNRNGETGRLLSRVGIGSIAALEDRAAIESQLVSFVSDLQRGSAFVVPQSVTAGFSRKELSRSLSRVLQDATSEATRL